MCFRKRSKLLHCNQQYVRLRSLLLFLAICACHFWLHDYLCFSAYYWIKALIDQLIVLRCIEHRRATTAEMMSAFATSVLLLILLTTQMSDDLDGGHSLSLGEECRH